jgi:hypothetical protein
MLISSNIGRKDKGNFDFYITRSGFCGGFATLLSNWAANRLLVIVRLSLFVSRERRTSISAGQAVAK